MCRFIYLALAALLGLFPGFVTATDKHCPIILEKLGVKLENCECNGPLLSYPYSGAKTLRLVAVCAYTKEPWGFTGDFYLVGNTLLHGEITREETETFGDWLTFTVAESSLQSLPTRDRSLRFSYRASATNRLHTPAITKKSPCWKANASIYLKKLYVREGPGTDADGSYIIDFEISKVARFKKCKPHE